MTTTIAIALFPDAEELDWAGPWEVLRAWQLQLDDDVSVFTVADTTSRSPAPRGSGCSPTTPGTTCPPVDVLVFPGGRGPAPSSATRPSDAPPSMAESGTLMTSVCTGSLVFADAGLLDGRPATTHWGSLDHLAALGTDVEVRPDDRFIDTGDVVTAAGVSAGIDMALHLVARLHSPERAREVRRYIQYDPEPPV